MSTRTARSKSGRTYRITVEQTGGPPAKRKAKTKKRKTRRLTTSRITNPRRLLTAGSRSGSRSKKKKAHRHQQLVILV